MTPVPEAERCRSACDACGGCEGRGGGAPEGFATAEESADPAFSPAAASDWRRVGATVDRNDTIPGPFGRPLQRLGTAENPFARIDGPMLAGLAPGARAIFTAVVAAPTVLSSALALTSACGQVELLIDWTEMPPGCAVMGRGAGLLATKGAVEALGFGAWWLALEARNETPGAVAVRPSLHVARGIRNAGLAVGLYAGMLRTGCLDAPQPRHEGPADA